MRLGENKISTEIDCYHDKESEERICSEDDPPYQHIPVSKIIVHEKYIKGQRHHDIALIKLQHEVILKGIKGIQTICLPFEQHQHIDDSTIATIAGWGRTTDKTDINDDLMSATVSYIPNEQCSQRIEDARKSGKFPFFYEYNVTDELLVRVYCLIFNLIFIKFYYLKVCI